MMLQNNVGAFLGYAGLPLVWMRGIGGGCYLMRFAAVPLRSDNDEVGA